MQQYASFPTSSPLGHEIERLVQVLSSEKIRNIFTHASYRELRMRPPRALEVDCNPAALSPFSNFIYALLFQLVQIIRRVF